jgi:hypothetical protein
MKIERRNYIRHPFSYPLDVHIVHQNGVRREHKFSSENIGAGGIQFKSDHCMPAGTDIEISLCVEGRRYAIDGTVVRCEPIDSDFHMVAVRFGSANELLKARLAEQAVRIELLKERLERRCGTELEVGWLAREWIRRYASAYARDHGM